MGEDAPAAELLTTADRSLKSRNVAGEWAAQAESIVRP